mgnify:FL=1
MKNRRALVIGRTTFYEVMKRQPDVSERYKRGRAKAIGSVSQSLIKKAIAGDNTAAIFYLKTQAGWRDQETVIAQDKPLEIEIVRASSANTTN